MKAMLSLTLFLSALSFVYAQKPVDYNLQQMLSDNRIITVPAYGTRMLADSMHDAITTKGIVWLKGVDFREGTIDLDLRGKDAFLNSFLGIAFYGTDTSTCDIIYFRPFNFHHTDSSRWKWSLAYMHIPDNNYAKLRKEHPGIYENSIMNAPGADQWFHVTIVIENRHARVFVNHAPEPSLEVTLLNNRSDGLFGLYSDGLTNDFANLRILVKNP